jgi:hypothetical protein
MRSAHLVQHILGNLQPCCHDFRGSSDRQPSEVADNATLREEALTTTSQGGRHRLSFSSSLRRRGKGHPVVPSFCSGASRKAHGGRPVARGTLRRTWAGARSTCCEARLNALTLARGGPISSGCLPENGAGNFGKFTRTGDALARTWSKPDFAGTTPSSPSPSDRHH